VNFDRIFDLRHEPSLRDVTTVLARAVRPGADREYGA
jgi:hypothetical protein